MNFGILIMIHCEQNTGYAIGRLEKTFYESSLAAGFTENQIFWSYRTLHDNANNNFCIEIDYDNPKPKRNIIEFIEKNKIMLVLAFDMGFPSKVIPILKSSGVKFIISYWGASMSSINSGFKLLLKKIEYALRKNKPDLFIFESKAMQLTAVKGRGVNTKQTKIIYLGVDTKTYYPYYGNYFYAHNIFNIPLERKIIIYSGHMEERKGVRVIMKAAIYLIKNMKYRNAHFIICGNQNDQANTYKQLLINEPAEQHVTFAGYREDVAELMRGSSIGVIASTGWDSFTMSSIEMMSSGLPMIVSKLQGLAETIVDNVNGYLVTPGDHIELATRIQELCNNSQLAIKFSRASRQRAIKYFNRDMQVNNLAEEISWAAIKCK